jgi:hypothetical protein
LIGVGDDVPLKAIDTLATAQGMSGEVAKDVDKHII